MTSLVTINTLIIECLTYFFYNRPWSFGIYSKYSQKHAAEWRIAGMVAGKTAGWLVTMIIVIFIIRIYRHYTSKPCVCKMCWLEVQNVCTLIHLAWICNFKAGKCYRYILHYLTCKMYTDWVFMPWYLVFLWLFFSVTSRFGSGQPAKAAVGNTSTWDPSFHENPVNKIFSYIH